MHSDLGFQYPSTLSDSRRFSTNRVLSACWKKLSPAASISICKPQQWVPRRNTEADGPAAHQQDSEVRRRSLRGSAPHQVTPLLIRQNVRDEQSEIPVLVLRRTAWGLRAAEGPTEVPVGTSTQPGRCHPQRRALPPSIRQSTEAPRSRSKGRSPTRSQRRPERL